MRRETIVSKAKKANIKIKDKPISNSSPWDEKYPLREPSGKKANARLGEVRMRPISSKSNAMVVSLPRKKEKIEKIVSHHISKALEREDEIKKLTIDQQIQFWRNTAKLNWKLFHATKHSKRLQWDACSKEIHRLNSKLEKYEGTADLVDPDDLKKNMEAIMSKRKGSVDSTVKDDDIDCFNYDYVCNIVDKVDQDEDEEKGGEDKEEDMEERGLEQKEEDKEEDKKEEDREEELFEEDKEQEKKEEDTDIDENEEDREEYFEEEDSEQEMKVDEKEEEIEQDMIKEEKEEEKRSVEKWSR
ncbi:glutamic acid-rich protein-like [Asparagus officinalis]|uniref:glutamic acid-rich protein-like n=1 Tax=Asparagus officinalis TaxID=4686 RepID=UPI00098E4CC8|nr:glutamic acid-rich protein-like [Asparagus officinalis]